MTRSSASLPTPKASSPMRSETVNPTPLSIDRPRTSHQDRSSSRRACVKVDISQVAPTTPSVFPTTRPRTIPTVIGSRSASVNPFHPSMATPAEKNAKIGTATAADSGRTTCSRCSASPRPSRPSRRSTGTVKPRSTPATVACTPEACTEPMRRGPEAPAATTTHPLLHECRERHDRDECCEEPDDLEVVGEEERDDRDGQQVVDDREGQQERPKRRRQVGADDGEDREREGDVSGGRDGPAAGPRRRRRRRSRRGR